MFGVVRPFALVSRLLIPVVTSFFVFTLTAHASPQTDSTRITAAANLTLRAMPSPDAAAVAQLPLGTEVVDTGPAGLEKTWVRVRLADSREGWLQKSLTQPLDPVWRWPTFDRIIADRLGRKGDGFQPRAELVAFIERVAPEYTDVDGRGRIELARLRAMSKALSVIPMTGARWEPYASWITARKTIVIYDGPGGHWMLSPSMLWEFHKNQAATTSADEIAWLAVMNGLAGECEGHLPCYLSARNDLHAEYLRRHPFGKHAAEAVAIIKSTADVLTAPAKSGGSYAFDKKRDCRDVLSAVDALTAAVQGTRADGRDGALASLGGVKRLCQ
jgi:hypothetical protein